MYDDPVSRLEFSWARSRSVPIVENGEPVVPASLCPDRVVVLPQYYLEGIEGALPELYLREGVLRRLVSAAGFLPAGHRIVLMDGWRSTRLQNALFSAYVERLREKSPNALDESLREAASQFVALPSCDPARPSPHLTGGAVDCTIADADGVMLDMGSGFDETSQHSITRWLEDRVEAGETLSGKDVCVLRNRRMLHTIMRGAGFTNYPEEWWHFDFGNQNWALLTEAANAFYGPSSPEFAWRNPDK
ncbi:MAG: M15 family metallopeptidase [Thermovirgaceae bacterium]|nr:M15 family metallopeptidase [Thermovirgaceae bacterium]